MVKFTVPIKDILGKAYYRYELTSTHYNTTTSQTGITITCTCKNIFGNPVANKELTLYHQNSIQGTATTNANGIATWTVGDLGAGNQIFWVEDATIIIRITNGGWKTYTPAINSYTTLYYNDDTRTVEFHYYRTNYSFTGTSAVTLHSGAIPSAYRPKSNINLTSYNATIVGAVNTSGDILSATSTTGTKNINLTAMWHY